MKKAVKDKIKRIIDRHPEYNNSQVNCALKGKERVGAAGVAKARAALGLPAKTESRGRPILTEQSMRISAPSGGLSLTGRDVLARKPSSVWPARFNALRKNTGYPVDVLANQWQCSLDLVKSKAKSSRCLRYVQNDNGEFVPCVVHPSTPGGK